MRTYYASDVSALVPELWANESLLILEEEMVMGGLVYRDFEPIVARQGEIVHAHRPCEFTAERTTKDDNVTDQDTNATDIEVRLNQYIDVSFVLKDEDMSKSFKDLVTMFLKPAMLANARFLDRCLAAQMVRYLANTRGALGGVSSSTIQNYLVDADDLANQQKMYTEGRNMVVTSNTRAQMLKTDLFVSADKSADGGRALRDAAIGRLFGYNLFLDLNTPKSTGSTTTTTTTSAAAAKGAASVAITAAVGVGRYVTVAGDMTPLRSTTNTTTLTPTRVIREAVGSGAVVTKYPLGAVDLSGGYLTGYTKAIHVDGGNVPKVGQIVAFNSGDETTGTVRTNSDSEVVEYVIVGVTNTAGSDYDIMLDRPLEHALTNDDVVCYGPDGDYNFGFHRNALALVNRPLALPMAGTGARAAVASYNNMSMRVTIQYDSKARGTRVVVDGLFGVAPLDTNLGLVMLG